MVRTIEEALGMSRQRDALNRVFTGYISVLQHHPIVHLFDGTLTDHDEENCEVCP